MIGSLSSRDASRFMLSAARDAAILGPFPWCRHPGRRRSPGFGAGIHPPHGSPSISRRTAWSQAAQVWGVKRASRMRPSNEASASSASST